MRSTKLRFRALFASLVWAPFVAAAAANDSVWTSQQDRCSIALPNANWSEKKPPIPDVKWFAVNQAKTKLISLAVLSYPQGTTELSRSGFDEGYLKSFNGTKIKGDDFAIDERTAYRLVAESEFNGKKVFHVVVVLISHGRAYRIAAQSFVGDVDTDPEINASINSFHLLDPPDPPTPANRDPATEGNSANRIGQALGGFCVLLLIGVFVVQFARRFAVRAEPEDTRRNPPVSRIATPPRPQPTQLLSAEQADFFVTIVKNRLAAGDTPGAAQFYQQQRESHPDWKLGKTDLMALIKSLHQQRLWSELVRPMVDYIGQFPENAARMQLKLAQVLVDVIHRPAKALNLLRSIDVPKLPPELQTMHDKLRATAEQLHSKGDLEIADDENW